MLSNTVHLIILYNTCLEFPVKHLASMMTLYSYMTTLFIYMTLPISNFALQIFDLILSLSLKLLMPDDLWEDIWHHVQYHTLNL